MNITLRTKPLRNGKLRFWIDYYDGKRLAPEILKELWIYETPKTHDEKQHNKRNWAKARDIREQRQADHDKGVLINSAETVSFYFTEYYNNVAVAKEKCYYSLREWKSFLKAINREGLLMRELTAWICDDFGEHLKKKYTQQATAREYFYKFAMMIKYASKRKAINFSRSELDVKFVVQSHRRKRYIPDDELMLIANYPKFKNTVKALLFCVNTGFGRAELQNKNPDKILRWKHISDGLIKWKRGKTNKPVTIALSTDAIELIGERKNDNDPVFTLPGESTVRWQLKRMCEELKIPHTTFYCGRHTFIPNALISAQHAGVVSDMTGSNISSLKHYNHIKEQLIRDAIGGLPSVLGKPQK